MIIETPYKTGDTISFKTTAGEEVIARLEAEKADSVKVSKPMVLTATQEGLGMVPFTFTVNPETSLEVFKHGVVFLAKTDEDTAKQYVQSTTGIAV